jgi:hypothetical protein
MAVPWDNVKQNYSTKFLRELTNPDQTTLQAVNDTIGNQAGAQAVAEFGIVVGVSYNSSLAAHNFAINDLVIYILQTWANKLGDSADKREKMVYGRMERLRKTTASARIMPTTTSPDVPTDDSRSGAIPNPLPEFDVIRFDQVTPNPPNGSGTGTGQFPFPL